MEKGRDACAALVVLLLALALCVSAAPFSGTNILKNAAMRPINPANGRTTDWWLDRIDQASFTLDDRNYRSTCTPGLGSGVDVYILNYGCEYGNADLSGQSVQLLNTELSAITPGAGSRDLSSNSMGTYLASLVGGADYGLAPNANVKCVQFAEEFGESRSSALEALQVIKRIETLARSGSNPKIVVVMALNSRKALKEQLPILLFDTYIKNCADAGVIFITTANDILNTDDTLGNACSYAPSFSNEAINVAAMSDGSDTTNFFWDAGSSFNSASEACIDFVAPGVNVEAAVGTGSGTEVKSTNKAAAALVGAVAALVASGWPNSYFQPDTGFNPTERFDAYLNSPAPPVTSAGSNGQTYPIAYLRCDGPPDATDTPLPTATPTATPTVAPATATPTPVPTNAAYAQDCAAAYTDCDYVLEVLQADGTNKVYNYSDPSTPGLDDLIDLKPCTSGCTGQYVEAGNNISYRIRAKSVLESQGLSSSCEEFDPITGIFGYSTDWSGRTDFEQAEILANIDDGDPLSAPWTNISNVVDFAGFPSQTYFYSQYYNGTSPTCPGEDELNVLFQQDTAIPSTYQAKMEGRCYRVYISDVYFFTGISSSQAGQGPSNCFAFRASGTLLAEDSGFTV